MIYKKAFFIPNGYLQSYKKAIKVSDVCQLVPKYNLTYTDRGVTFTHNGDGSITINGTPTGTYYSLSTITLDVKSIKHNHKYLIYDINNEPIISEIILASYTGGYVFKGIGDISTFPEHNYNRFVFEIRVNLNQTANNIVIKPQLFDLTEMYGAGNEPKTVAEFRQKFPNDLYPYRPYCFVDSYKKTVKVSDIMQIVGKPISGAGTTKELYGITYNFLADGTGVTLTGTATYTSVVTYFTFWKPVSGHKYLWLYGRENGGESTAYFEIKWTDKNGAGHWFSGEEQIYPLSPTATEGYATRIDFHLIVPAGQTCNGFTWHPQCFDLTEMYGQGNEPKTVEEFKTKFPNDYYAYKPYSFI